ncbi:MAG: heavy metal-associated domain-containing protein [Gemmataceae bacterium]
MRTALCVTLFAAAVAGAQIPVLPAGPYTYRVTGLFSKEREADLRAAFETLPEFKLTKVSFDDAELTVEFAPAKLFPGQKVERVTELVNDRLRGASGHTFGLKPRRTVPREKLQQVVIPAAGLDCNACCLAAYEIVAAVDGVEQATASFKEGRITALIDPARTDRAKLEEALTKRGVKVGK